MKTIIQLNMFDDARRLTLCILPIVCGMLLLLQPNPVRAAVPVISSMGSVETAGTAGGRPHMAADNEGQPHIVVQSDRGVLKLFDRINGSWRTPATFTSSSELNFPRTVIDQHNNRQWISAVMIQLGNVDGCGMAILTRSGVNDTPSGINSMKHLIGDPSGIPLCMIDLNAGKTDLSYVYGNFGVWQEFGINANGSIRATANKGSKLLTRNLGERNLYGFAISRAGGMWHASYNGHPQLSSVRYSGYLNDARVAAHQGEIPWNDPAIYVDSGGADEDKYQAICADAKNNQAAYFAIHGNNGRIYVNIYNGTTMLYSKTAPLSMSGDSGISRYAPQWAMAKDGGAWLCWQYGGKVFIRYFGLDKVHGDIIEIGSGNTCTIAADNDGNVHVAYMSGSSTKYRKCMVSGYGQISPKGRTADATPLFTWNDTTGAADRYWIELRKADNSLVFRVPTNGTAASYLFNDTLALGSYKWYLDRVDNNQTNRLGPMDFYIVPGAPVQRYPVGNFGIAQPSDIKFTWDPEPNCDRYQLVVQKSGGSTLVRTWLTGVASTSYVPPTAGTWAGGDYSWWVQGSSSVARVAGAWSPAATFRLTGPAAPTILWPQNRGSILATDTVNLVWSQSAGATSYRLWINKGGVHTWNVTVGGGVTNFTPDLTSVPTQADFDPDSYQWWVYAIGVYGTGPWSASNAFFRTRVMTPGNGEVVTDFRPTFLWSGTAGASTYRLLINRDGKRFYDAYIGSTTWWQSATDMAHGNYVWWIQAWKGDVAGSWLKSANFVIPDRTPAKATLYEPTGVVAVAGNQMFAWTNVPFATWYEFYLKRNGTKVADKWINGNAITTTLYSVTAADYEWWVRTWNVDGYGPWSASRKFSCDKCRIVTPPSGTVYTRELAQLHWLGLPGAIEYEVSLKRNGTQYKTYKTGSPATTWTATAEWPTGSYEWWVRDIDAAGAGIWSLSSTFRTQWGIPGAVTLVYPLGAPQAAGTVTYEWNADVAATWYKLLIHRNGTKWYEAWHRTGAQDVGSLISVGVNNHTTATYKWWVFSWGPDGNGAWSTAGTFTVP